MKSEIVIYCDNERELQEFARRILNVPNNIQVVQLGDFVEPTRESIVDAKPELPAVPGNPAPVTKTRKPRADAGKPRGPYKSTGADAGTTASSTPGTTPAADAVGGDPVTTESPSATPTAAASAPTNSAAPTQAITPAPESATPAAAEPAKELTETDARAALARINQTAGLAMPACMAHLAKFGVDRITKLPKEKYAEFIKSADELIAARKAAAK